MKKVVLGIAIVLSATSNGMSNNEISIGARDVISKTGDTCGISISRDFQCNLDISAPNTNLIFDVNGHNFSNRGNITAKSLTIIANNVMANDRNVATSIDNSPENVVRNHIISQGNTCNISLSQDFRNDGVINLPSINLVFNLNGNKFSNYGRIHAKSITIRNGHIEAGNDSIIDAVNSVNIESEQVEGL